MKKKMSDRIRHLGKIEEYSLAENGITALNPLIKMLVTGIYIFCVMLHGRYECLALCPYFFYPFIVMALADIPYREIWGRAVLALPFCLFAGISNLIFDRVTVVSLGPVVITAGMVSMGSIFVRTLLCVAAILILAATTPVTELTAELLRLHVPAILVQLVEMTYRYIGVLVGEAEQMLLAYTLRKPGSFWPTVSEFGNLVGQLFLKSMDRAERIYHAMILRGYAYENRTLPKRRALTIRDILFFLGWGGSAILFFFL